MNVKAEYDFAQKNKVTTVLNIALRGDRPIHPSDPSPFHGLAALQD